MARDILIKRGLAGLRGGGEREGLSDDGLLG